MTYHDTTDIQGRGQIRTQWLKTDPGVVNWRAMRVCETPQKCTMKLDQMVYRE